MGHTLDVVITRKNDPIVDKITITQYNLSHHFLIDFVFKMQPKETKIKTIIYRDIKNIDSKKFSEDIAADFELLPKETDLKGKIMNYNTVMTKAIKKHAPLKTREIKVVPQAPWFDEEYAVLRRQRRKAEKKYKKTGLQCDKELYNTLRKRSTSLAKDKKKTFISNKLASIDSNKNLFSVVNNLLDNSQESILPTGQSDEILANEFSKYFSDKVKKIRSSIKFDDIQNTPRNPNTTVEPLSQFKLAKIVTSFGIKCSPEDPVPVTVIKNNLELLLPYWLEIVNLSLEMGSMECLKSAVILPLIKDLGSLVDRNDYKNYRPVSNLLFISKLVERIVNDRLEEHMMKNNLHSGHQFGYKKHHSTEYLLLKIVNNLLLAFDNNMPSIVLFMDMSAAFDTVDHAKLLDILHCDVGICGTAYDWCESFLTKDEHFLILAN